ncbi:MAG: Peptide chain release factor 2 [Planctomycetota bacterium]|jgi:peptide chain release factor 2
MGEGDFWNDPKAAQKVINDLKVLRAQVEPLEGVMRDFEDAQVGYQLAKEAGDADMLREVDETLFGLQSRMDAVERQSLLSGKHDHRNCFVSIQAGAGGAEAEDWAGMLERMYLYYWNEMGWKVEELHRTPGSEAGINDVNYRIEGPFAFGYMNCERGTHRLARVSPFNAEGKRQTSFATVDITPEFEETDLEIPAKDLEIVPFVRASGPGGQNVNKVATAIRVTHLPTGIQVVASTFRDQPQNRKQALGVLRGKLEQLEEERRAAEIAAVTGGKVTRDWGSQIRSYVFYDNRVKDHRTGHETGNPQHVLDGHVADFIDAELKRRRTERERAGVET